MGKKAKTGKARRDKFYKLAKETGYRARSAFKLLQLNRKFEFLQKSRVCIDLCAAPGGWLQVAAEHMPVSSVIVGVDLVSIKPIPNCVTLMEDITTDKCRTSLRKELQTWKADVVLNDGAPNVGKNWVFDAFAQAELTLHALKLATEFLRKGGWFVTKVFRSKDYHALMWVLNQLFKKVHATKPQASRNESAEIFVVCQGFHAPDKLDPKFLDPKHVFKDVMQNEPESINLLHPEKVKRKAEGYADNDLTLFHAVTDLEFMQTFSYLEMLAMCSQIKLETPFIKDHELTTTEVKECCKDIKVLGKTELREIINWRKKMFPIVQEYLKQQQKENQGDGEEMEGVGEEEKDGENEGDEEERSASADEEEQIKEQLANMQSEESKDAKRKQRKVAKEKRKLRDKMALNMIIPGDVIEQTEDISLFDLKRIKSKQQLRTVEKDDMAGKESDSDEEFESLPKYVEYDRHEKDMDNWSDGESSDLSFESGSDEEGSDGSDEEDDAEEGSEGDNEEEEEVDEKSANPLVVNMESKDQKRERKAALWFRKDVFQDLEQDKDEDIEIEEMTAKYEQKGGVIVGRIQKTAKRKSDDKDSGLEDSDESDSDSKPIVKKQKTKTKLEQAVAAALKDDQESSDENEAGNDDDDTTSSSSDEESDEESYRQLMMKSNLTSKRELRKQRKEAINKSKKDGFEIVSTESVSSKIRKLDPVSLAIGEEMVKSGKRRREIIDDSYNRYTFNDENLPDWFVTEEKQHMKRQMPVTKEQVQVYKERQKLIDAAPIKKIAEAKARKKKKMGKRLEKARKKAEVISDAVDVSQKEKLKQMKDVYRKAGLLKAKKENVEYVVAKRGAGKRVSRPAGVKGRFKVVDPRMKKDKMRQKKDAKNKRKGGKSKGGRKR